MLADRLSRVVAPLVLGLIVLGIWEGTVRAMNIPPYLLPGPILIGKTLITDWSTLMDSWWITMSISLAALTAAVVLGVFLAVLFASSRWIEQSFFPYAVILQVTPIVAIAPLIIIWVNDVKLSLLICAWIVAFFPILSNTTVGLNSA
ncbi:MAG TPA: ABC transporter permease, partial [Reyranella sp.]